MRHSLGIFHDELSRIGLAGDSKQISHVIDMLVKWDVTVTTKREFFVNAVDDGHGVQLG